MKKKYLGSFMMIGGFFLFIISNCKNLKGNIDKKGRELITQHCSSCHQATFADALDSATWIDGVLPAMAPKFNLRYKGKDEYALSSTSTISLETWDSIRTYFKDAAPKNLQKPKSNLQYSSEGFDFSLNFPQRKEIEEGPPTTTLVGIKEQEHTLFWGNAKESALNILDSSGRNRRIGLPSAPVNLYSGDLIKGLSLVTCIGKIQASNEALGEIVVLGDFKGENKTESLFNYLRRPVQVIPEDFNQDGLVDYLICEFGHGSGGLYLFQQKSDGGFEKHMLSPLPGAEEIVVKDFNGDGWPDIMCLFAQGREGIWLFQNDGEGGFETNKLLEFPPYFGSTSFQLIDFNGDGLLDILYTCGDNADYSQTLKPFHGIYIYLNQGHFKYEKAFFYPIDGCTKARAADFNNDGILDIVSIAFFADFKTNPQQGFVYLQGKGGMDYEPVRNDIYKYGRWLTMDVGDLDGDGKKDILLGNYLEGFRFIKESQQYWNRNYPFLLLRNQTLIKDE